MDCRNGFSAAPIRLWLECEDVESRRQDHGDWRATERRPEDRDRHQSGGWQRPGSHARSRGMKTGFLGSIFVLLTFTCSVVLLAQSSKQPEAVRSMPNLSGTWNRSVGSSAAGIPDDDASGVPFFGFAKQEPSLQPTAMET